MKIPKRRLKSKQWLQDTLSQSFNGGIGTHTHILVGAGFSHTAGIPLASEIAGILARYKNMRHKNHSADLTYSTVVKDFFDKKFCPKNELEELKSNHDLTRLDSEEIYKALFSDDDEIFPDKSVSRGNFMANLIAASRERYHGYNLESLYLAYLCDHARRHGHPKIDTILTTNFDDILPISFFELSAPCRLLDQWRSIEREEPITYYPRIVYLHGRYLYYDIANTEVEIRNRSDLIANFLRRLPQASKLIVIGYSGWEDEIMNGLKTLLQEKEHKRFAAGIHWCLHGNEGTASKQLLDLITISEEVTVTTEITALAAMRIFLEAAGCTETSVLQSIRDTSNHKRHSFERNLVEINERDLGYDGKAEFTGNIEDTEPPSVEQAIAKGQEALDRASSSSIAFSMMQSVLRRRPQMSPKQEAALYRTRGALRFRYKIDIEGAISDYQFALKLDNEETFGPTVGLADAYASLAKYNRARHFLKLARKQLTDGSTAAQQAHCDIIEGSIEFQNDNLDLTEQLLTKAIGALESFPEVDLLLRASIALIFGLIYNGEEDRATELIGTIRNKHGRQIKGKYWEGVLLLAEGQIYLQRDSPSAAKKALKKAQELIERGPHFQKLGDIAFQMADAFFRCNKWKEGEHAELAAIQYYGLAGIGFLQIRAAAWLEMYRAVRRKDFNPEWQELAKQALRRYEEKADPAESATYWSVLAVHCMSNKVAHRQAAELARDSVKTGNRLFETFQRRMAGRDMGPNNMRHKAFVAQFVKLADILVNLIYPSGRIATGLKEDFLDIRDSCERFGFYSSYIELLFSIAAAYIIRVDPELAARSTPSSKQSKAKLVELCREKGYPYLSPLTRNL